MVTYLPEATFHALADPTRLAVLDLLRRGPQPAGQIAAAFPISRPAISKHLRQLRKARLVVESRSGRHRVYRLNPAPLQAANAWLERYRQFWQMNLGSLKTFVEQEYARESGDLSLKKPKKHKLTPITTTKNGFFSTTARK
ncbi:MAG: metalloregulator ArsR/SmtB family transcription factor [Terriglobales bacterium]